MFDDRKYRVATPVGGPGVLGPWRQEPHRDPSVFPALIRRIRGIAGIRAKAAPTLKP